LRILEGDCAVLKGGEALLYQAEAVREAARKAARAESGDEGEEEESLYESANDKFPEFLDKEDWKLRLEDVQGSTYSLFMVQEYEGGPLGAP
jgi:hypothetical protein